VLEIGCGVGAFTERILGHGGYDDLVSIDISEDAVAYCRQRFNSDSVHFVCTDVQKMDGSFDLIVCMNVLEHVKEDQETLNHIISLLNNNGTLFLLVPAHQWLFNRFDEEGGHFRRYDKETLDSMLKNGNHVEHCHIKHFYFNMIGAVGYWFVYKILRKLPQSGAKSEIGIFDKILAPIMRRIEGVWTPFGISLISIITKVD
jgi:SAM-dependent methyltransferase